MTRFNVAIGVTALALSPACGVLQSGPSDKEMGDMLLKHVDHVMHWMDKQPNIKYVTVSYNEMIKDAKDSIAKINQLLGGGLNTAGMAGVVDQQLYRQRK